MNHRFNINGTTYVITELQLSAIFAILRLIPLNMQSKTYGNEKYGDKVRAIRFTRELMKIGLKEAKDLVDLMDARATWTDEGYVKITTLLQSVEYLGTDSDDQRSIHEGGGRTASLGQILRDKLSEQDRIEMSRFGA